MSKETGIEYDEVQVETIRQAIASKVMVLTGGPGMGKTTTTKAIIAALQSAGMRILLAAPTGRTAKRMSEATGMEAKQEEPDQVAATIVSLVLDRLPKAYCQTASNVQVLMPMQRGVVGAPEHGAATGLEPQYRSTRPWWLHLQTR